MSRTDLINGVYREYPLDNSTEGYSVGHVKPPYGTVTKLEYHQPQGEGDAHYVDVYFDDNKLPTERIFKPDSISWQPAPKHDTVKYNLDKLSKAESMKRVSAAVGAGDVKRTLEHIYNVVKMEDIPSPTIPEYREHHEAITRILKAIKEELNKYDDL